MSQFRDLCAPLPLRTVIADRVSSSTDFTVMFFPPILGETVCVALDFSRSTGGVRMNDHLANAVAAAKRSTIDSMTFHDVVYTTISAGVLFIKHALPGSLLF